MKSFFRRLLKVMGGVALALLILLGLAYFIWVPGAEEPSYELVKVWGGKGTKPGRFNEPTGIAVTDDEVFVSDARNGRIQVFDQQGRFKRAFQDGLQRPMNVDIVGDKLYVADFFTEMIHVFSLDGTPNRVIAPEDGLNKPGGVAAAADGTLYVADTYNQRVLHLTANGRILNQWGGGEEPDASPGQFSYPTDVAVTDDGTLFVADGYNDRVQVFDPKGQFLRKWGGPFAANIYGPFNGWFITVTSIALGPRGNVFVADFYNDRVQKFTPEGQFLTAFGRTPPELGHTAIAVAIDDNDTVFVADYARHRVQEWQRPR
ncbi:MAG: NHL repeat-containing protein [Gammaproteobacteria bacterium]